MQLASNWRSLWKAFSTQALALLVLLQGLIAAVPPHLQAVRIPLIDYTYGEIAVALSVVIAVLGLVGRYIDQGLPSE